MADDGGKTYNNSPGFTDTGNGVVADPTTVGSDTDYRSWDWKQIMAAITGSAATTDSAQGAGVADPSSLSRAAQQLLHVQRTLEMIGKNLGEQRDALTKNGAWKGEAADSFSAAIDSFMADVHSQAEALGGSSKGWGSTSLPNQLQRNGVELSTAQQRVHEIDAWYAHQAQLAGVQPMSNGLIPVSQKPEIVTMLNNSMREVIDDLAGRYKVTTNAAVPPTPGDTQLGGGDLPPPPNFTPPPTYTPPPPTDGGPGPQDFGNGPGGSGPGAGPGSGPAVGPVDAFGGPTGVGDGGAGLGGGPDLAGGPAGVGAAFTPTAFDGPTGLGGVGSGVGGVGSGLGADGAGMDAALNPAGGAAPVPFPGATGLGAGSPGAGAGLGGGAGAGLDPTLKSPAPFADPGLGDAPAGLGDGAGGPAGAPAPFPGSTGLGDGAGGLGDGAGGLGDGAGGLGGAAAPFPGATGLGDGLPGGLSADMPDLGAVGSAGGAGAAGSGGAGMPMMPPMGGLGAGGAGGATSTEPSDASGLISRAPEPFAGDTSLGDPGQPASGTSPGGISPAPFPGATGLGEPAGLPGLDGLDPSGSVAPFPGATDLGAVGSVGGAAAGAGGAGMPMMPPMGGMGAGGAGGAKGLDPSDSSGLIARAPEPFAGDTGLGDPGQMAAGAGPSGSPGSVAPFPGSTDLGAVGSVGGAGAGGAGMPMMPPMGGMGAGGANAGVESPDAAGLLSRTPEPFAGETSLGDPGAMAPGSGDITPVSATTPEPGAPGTGERIDPGAVGPTGAAGAGAGSGGAGMPMMPPMGGAGAGSGESRGTEPPDAAGLVARGTEGFAEPAADTGQPVGGVPAAGAPWLPGVPGARGEREPAPERPGSADLLEADPDDFGHDPSSGTPVPGPTRSEQVEVPEPPDDGSAWELDADGSAWWSGPSAGEVPPDSGVPAEPAPGQVAWARWTPEHTPAPPPPVSLSCADAPEVDPAPESGPDEDDEPEAVAAELPRSASDLLSRSAAWWNDPGTAAPGATPAPTSSVWG